ncbi:ComEC family competence protein [Novosphingobium sp. ERN07]|uniref:ComEC/Rec2 family competence protein n=1 Tax=Novosphingobium sp. ERN07 TaxID=2726187 RepID=UPI0014567C5A|nr:ComEC/Rec2 family competence protein [Novosphingobium sp. ERN07]NLR71437.1 ComEC family competence protein [Novosphingobium sp. ERN07]
MASPAADGPAADFPAADPGTAPAGRARHWAIRARLSSVLDGHLLAGGERFLDAHPFERGLWLVVAFAAGIVAWVALPTQTDWIALLLAALATALMALAWLNEARIPHVRLALFGLSIMFAAGTATVWIKSTLVGQPGIAGPSVVMLDGRVLERREEPAKGRARLLLLARLPEFADPVRVRVNLRQIKDAPAIVEGAQIRLRARLMPPAAPMLPGAYDFARTAWFDGLAATGTALGNVTVVRPSAQGATLRGLQRGLEDHVRAQLGGSPGTIAAALASGDRGAIAEADEDAMRDAGLTHLLSISGLHVSALVGAVYVLVARLLAAIPWIALRVRVPIAAALMGALAGIAYTLLTGAEVPTIRSCIGALLVLVALALGRDPLSLRMVAVGALVVMLFWPEAVLGPSFQMSFAAVIAIIAFHSAAPVRGFLTAEHHGPLVKLARNLILLLATGLVIELALMPIGLFHFHRAGIYGSLANVIAIPLTTFVTMPLIGLALLLDSLGFGAPAWWLAGKSLELLLALAHFVAARPGAVTMLPAVAPWTFMLFIAGMLWLALWTGKVRLWGALPASFSVAAMILTSTPDVLITGDGHHVGITGEGDDLIVLRMGRGDYMRDNLLELAGMEGDLRPMAEWSGARCSEDFCVVRLYRHGKRFKLLISRSRAYVDDMALAAACERADIVVADRRLPFSCRPKMLKADRVFLSKTSGLSINLATGKIRTVAETQGRHGWYRWPESGQLD